MTIDQIYSTLVKAYLAIDELIVERCESGDEPCSHTMATSAYLWQALEACTPYYTTIEAELAAARWAERKATEEADKPALPF